MPTTPFLKMFSRSPVKPLHDHMKKSYECAKELEGFFQAVIEENWALAETLQHKIAHLEHDADTLKRDLRMHLPKSVFLPVPRTDILELISVQDQVANCSKDIAGLVLGRQMNIPKEIQTQFIHFLQRSIAAVEQAHKTISELGDLFEAGFSGGEARLIAEMVEVLDKLENETDEMQIKVRRGLFQLEASLPAVNVMFLYKVIEWVGLLGNHAERIGHRIQIFSAR